MLLLSLAHDSVVFFKELFVDQTIANAHQCFIFGSQSQAMRMKCESTTPYEARQSAVSNDHANSVAPQSPAMLDPGSTKTSSSLGSKSAKNLSSSPASVVVKVRNTNL